MNSFLAVDAQQLVEKLLMVSGHRTGVSGDIVLDMPRFLSKPRPWRGDAYTYRIEP